RRPPLRRASSSYSPHTLSSALAFGTRSHALGPYGSPAGIDYKLCVRGPGDASHVARGGADAAVRKRRRGRGPAEVEEPQQVDRVREVEEARVIGVRGILARGSAPGGEGEVGRPDRVRDVQVAVSRGVPAPEALEPRLPRGEGPLGALRRAAVAPGDHAPAVLRPRRAGPRRDLRVRR